MRHYARNSPQAAARILALALLSDGHLCKRELDTLDRLQAHATLGLSQADLHAVVHGFCEDLLGAMHMGWGSACQVDPDTLAALMADIDAPALRNTLVQLCVAVVEADDHVAEGESVMLTAAVVHWDMHRDLLAVRPTTGA